MAGEPSASPPRSPYCARPPFALDRIEQLPDGRIAYLAKTPRNGRTHRVMTPVDFIARPARDPTWTQLPLDVDVA